MRSLLFDSLFYNLNDNGYRFILIYYLCVCGEVLVVFCLTTYTQSFLIRWYLIPSNLF